MNMLEALAVLPRLTNDKPANSETTAMPGVPLMISTTRSAHLPRALERGAVGQLQVTKQVALVLGGNEPGGHMCKTKLGQGQQAHVKRQPEAAVPQ